MNWFSKLWSLFKLYFVPCAQSATEAAEDAGVITKETADEIEEVIEGLGALDKIVSRSLELIGSGLPENSLIQSLDDKEEDVDNGIPGGISEPIRTGGETTSGISGGSTPVELEQPPRLEPDP